MRWEGEITLERMTLYPAAYEIMNEVAVEGFAPAAPAADPEKKPEEKESVEDIAKRARKPPSEGPCKGCGNSLPLNRLFLCFKCWVKKNLLDDSASGKIDWIPGDPHPAYCGCGLQEHSGGPRE